MHPNVLNRHKNRHRHGHLTEPRQVASPGAMIPTRLSAPSQEKPRTVGGGAGPVTHRKLRSSPCPDCSMHPPVELGFTTDREPLREMAGVARVFAYGPSPGPARGVMSAL